jgi:hypothetical protein
MKRDGGLPFPGLVVQMRLDKGHGVNACNPRIGEGEPGEELIYCMLASISILHRYPSRNTSHGAPFHASA